MIFDPAAILVEAGEADDAKIDLTLCALALAAPEHEGISVERYSHHIAKLSADVRARFNSLIEGGADDSAQTRLAALKHILADREGYHGDIDNYDDLQNADLMRVIDRRKGMPIALCILYIQVGRNSGFDVQGVNFPGHFLCRIEHAGVRLIFDPFERCELMEAPQLRQLIKRVRGPHAELSADYYETASNRDILIRLQNNVKLRLIEASDYKKALHSVEMMRLVDPQEHRLLLDAGVLYAKTNQKQKAIEVLEAYLTKATNPEDRYDAQLILDQLR